MANIASDGRLPRPRESRQGELATHLWHFGHSSLPTGCPQPPLHLRPPAAVAAESLLIRASPDSFESSVRGTISSAVDL